MTNDETILFVTRYRASAEDEATPILDRAILAAAGRQAAKRRLVRYAGGGFFVTVLTALSVAVAWRFHQTDTGGATFTITNYGVIEGVTRSYLLEVGTTQYRGPGLTENTQ